MTTGRNSQLSQLGTSVEAGTWQKVKWQLSDVKFMSIIVKIGEWIVKWHLKVIIVSWIVLNDKWVEHWRWWDESSGQENNNLGKIVKMKNTKIKITVSKYTQSSSLAVVF